MQPTDSPWDDTGFGPEDDAFMADPTKPLEPMERKRVESMPPLPPPQQDRKKPIMFWMGMGAGILLFIAVIGGGYYYFSRPTIEEQAFVAPEEKPLAQPTPSEPAAFDTATDVVAVDSVPEPAPLSVEAEPPVATTRVVRPTETTPKAMLPPKPIQPAKTRLSPRPIVPVIETTPPPPRAAGAMFVVQVFSSPSRDDADEWLQNLREKNVKDGYIVEQKMRGQSWYRVRYGQYSSREDAEASAVNLGFKQPWIARVR